MQTGQLRLFQRDFHDLLIDTFDFDVHLQCSDTLSSTRYLEVHVTQVIFITENIGKHGKLIALFHQTHSNTGNGCFQGYASRHHGQRTDTHRRHRA